MRGAQTEVITTYTHIPTATVLQAVEDRINGNRPLTSRAYLERRIAEIRHDRAADDSQFQDFVKFRLFKVKE